MAYTDVIHPDGLVLDAFDLKILVALERDGRLTDLELSRISGLSASNCSRRRIRLEEQKVISCYRAILASDILGFAVVAFIQIRFAIHTSENARTFRALIQRIGDIHEAYSLAGDADYLLKVVLRDLKQLSDMVNNVLMPHPSVTNVRSFIVLDRLKERSKLALDR